MQNSQDSCRGGAVRGGEGAGSLERLGGLRQRRREGQEQQPQAGRHRGPLETAGLWAETGPRDGSDIGSQLCEGSADSDHLAWHSLASSGSHRRPCLLLFISSVNSGGERSAESRARIHRRKTL